MRKKGKNNKRTDSTDPLYIGVPNICFSLVGDRVKDTAKARQQRTRRGFDDTELWNLDATIAKFVLPRLKAFRKKKAGHPGCFQSMEEWTAALLKMERAFELIIADVLYAPESEEEKAINEGLDLFRQYFLGLWY